MCVVQTGLGILQQEGNVFKCFHSVLDAVWHAELGSSAAIFDAGYTIDSLMLRYAGVDWTNRTNHECNAM